MTKKKKRTRIGTVSVSLSYVADLADKEMVAHAKDMIFDDLANALSNSDTFEALVETKRDTKLKEGNINSYLLESMGDYEP